MDIYTEVFDQLPVACFVLDVSGKIISVNQQAKERFDTTADACTGKSLPAIMKDDFTPGLSSVVDQVSLNREIATLNYFSTATQQMMRCTVSPIQQGVLLTFIQIEEQPATRQANEVFNQQLPSPEYIADAAYAERNLKLMHEVSQVLITLSNTGQIMEMLAEQIAAHFSVRRITLLERNEATDSSYQKYNWYHAGTEDLHRKNGHAEALNKYLAILGTLESTLVVNDELALIASPVSDAAEVKFLLCISDPEPRRWRVDEIELLAELTKRIWQHLEGVKANEALQKSHQRFDAILQQAPIAIAITGPAGEILFRNKVFDNLLGKNPPNNMNAREYSTVYEGYNLEGKLLRSEEWPAAKAVLEGKTTRNEVLEIIQHDGCHKFCAFNAAPIRNEQGNISGGIVFFNDVTATREVEAALRQSDKLYRLRLEQEVKESTAALQQSQDLLRATLDNNPEMIQVFKAVRNDFGKIIDFIWILHNATAERINGQVIGKSLLKANPAFLQEGGFRKFVEVCDSGLQQQYELHYRLDSNEGWYHQSIVRMEDGVATNTVDITNRKQAEQDRNEQAHFVQGIADIIPDVITVVELASKEVIFNNRDLLGWLGYTALELTALSAEQRRLLYLPDDQLIIEDFYARFNLLQDHEIIALEYRLKNKQQDWLNIALRGQVFRRDQLGRVTHALIIAQDITQRKQGELALKHNRDQLQTIFDTTLVGMSVFAAVKDDNGLILDFRILLVNKKIERSTGRADMVGMLYSELHPGVRETGLFELMVKTYESAEPGKMEYHYTFEGIDRWYSTMFVKGEDILVSTNLDITDRKLAEQDQFRNYVLLQQSEELARTGSWDYEINTGKFTWSDGMYRLFDLEKGSAIKPEIYLDFAATESRATAKRIIGHLRIGDRDFEETIAIRVAGKSSSLHIKATVIKNEQGKAIRVLGVDLDVTALRESERRIRHMEILQQQEIFRVTLNTQEEERRRVSESLHNGLAQLLYGTQLSLNHLTVKLAATQQEKYEDTKKYTDELLGEAIKETRKISHELMPTVLAEFGLSAAIKEIGEQLQDGLKFSCIVTVDNLHLDNYLELAVYRTVQELMINVVKHASASRTEVLVQSKDRQVLIRVEDNGLGMPEVMLEKPGIGLSSIRNKVKLLNGKININSVRDRGTVIEVSFPILPFTLV